MALSPSEELTAQFYEWELRGRGWHYAAHTVELEPPFVPFFVHHVPMPYTDDGKRDTVISSILDIFRTPAPVPIIEARESEPVELYPFVETDTLVGYRISFAKSAKPSLEAMEHCLTMLSGIYTPISFELVADSTAIYFQLVYRKTHTSFIYSQLKAFFPDASIVPLDTVDIESLFDHSIPAAYTVDFGLTEETMRPLNTKPGYGDSLIGVLGLCEQLANDQRIIIQVLFNGTQNQWADSLERAASDGFKGSFFYDAPEMPTLAKEKCNSPLFAVTVRAVAQAATEERASELLQHIAYALIRASASPFNSLTPLLSGEYDFINRIADIITRQSHRSGMLLNVRELATFVHFPHGAISKKLVSQHHHTKAAPPHLINAPYAIGNNTHQGLTQTVGLHTVERLRHLHILGATGTGKSTLLQSLIMQDINNSVGCCVIDPHGDLIDTILNTIPEHRIEDVVLIDPSDGDFPVGFNILLAHSDIEKELLASDLVALFRRFSTSWGDQMNSVFANAISAFVYNKSVGTIGELRKFLIEQPFRNIILVTCTDPDIVYYWQKEYPLLKSSSIGSILTRLDSFLRPRIIRNMVCQKQSIDFASLMDTNKIVLVKLSQGLVGEENSYLLGAFIVSKLQQTAMARQLQQAQDRIPFYCYIDEFQHFVTPSMATILSGARKYGLGLVLAHQDMQQVSKVDSDIAASILANAGTRISFRLGDTDAKRMAEGFSAFTAEDLQSLGTGEAIVRVSTADNDFNIAVIPHEQKNNASYKDRIVAHSRSTYSVPIIVQSQQPDSVDVPPPIISQSRTPKAPPPAPVVPIIDAPAQQTEREHRYLQMFIKKLAEERGYIADIEVPTKDGKGLVDVLLEKDGQSIAIEISVTTPASWELHNIKKCLAAGYHTIVVCTPHKNKVTLIEKKIASELTTAEQQKVRVITPDQIPTLFIENETKETATVMKGYRVKLQYDQSAGNTSDIIQRIMNAGKKRQ